MKENTEYIVKEGIFYRRTSYEQELGPLSNIIQKARDNKISLFQSVFSVSIPEKTDYENGAVEVNDRNKIEIPVHIANNNTMAYAGFKLPYFPIRGTFRKTLGDDVRPMEDRALVNKTYDISTDVNTYSFSGANPTEQNLEYKLYKASAGITLDNMYLIYCFRTEFGVIRSCAGMYVLLYTGTHYMSPPFPNLFDNGKICLGQITLSYAETIQEIVQKSFLEFFFSVSNNHLNNDSVVDYLNFTMYETENGHRYVYHSPSIELTSGDFASRQTSIAPAFMEIITKL